eukprot:TRINITY_DN52249_c0_g1_i1.p1 TRINITY_DN52249_c0_g1~~TRINITY_DN52249_c0_g1_i1.p1  ORF type:complete len:596 (+),score=97.44 TRINITY_DN52249_c0_g1_i1:26-1813(+)
MVSLFALSPVLWGTRTIVGASAVVDRVNVSSNFHKAVGSLKLVAGFEDARANHFFAHRFRLPRPLDDTVLCVPQLNGYRYFASLLYVGRFGSPPTSVSDLRHQMQEHDYSYVSSSDTVWIIARNPYLRLLSFYVQRIAKPCSSRIDRCTPDDQQVKLGKLLGYSAAEPPSFEGFAELLAYFVDYLRGVGLDACSVNINLCSQVSGCAFREAQALAVLKLEKQSEWFVPFTSLIGLKKDHVQARDWEVFGSNPCFHTDNGNCSDMLRCSSRHSECFGDLHAEKTGRLLSDHYTARAATIVRALFAEDFELLGYESLWQKQREQPVFWLHLHQNAGTWMKECALKSEEIPLSPHDENLNSIAEGDTCEAPMLCRDKLSLMAHQNATWTAIERSFDVDREYCPGDFLYGVAITDPELYIHTSLRHRAGMHPQLLIDKLTGNAEIFETELEKPTCWGASPFGDYDKNVGGQYPQYDNFIIRSLLGYKVFWLPPGSIDRTHLERAREVIQRFDVILIVNDMTRHRVQLLRTFKWDVATVNASQVTSNRGYVPNNFQFDEKQTAFLLELNRFDRELYSFAKRLAEKKSAVQMMHGLQGDIT